MIDLILLAAGSGKRMQSTSNKQFLKINNIPILVHSLEKFYNHKKIDRIFIAIKREEENVVKSLLNEHGFRGVYLVYGGCERQDSVYNCLDYINSLDTDSYTSVTERSYTKKHLVLIHDGARPLISDIHIDKCIDETLIHRATCLAVPAKDTVKVSDKDLNIIDTPDRTNLWLAQTPQTFDFELLTEAYKSAYEKHLSLTDDASIVEAYAQKVKLVMGSYDNIKITTPEDIGYAEYIASKNENMGR